MKKGAKFNILKNVKTHGGLVKNDPAFFFLSQIGMLKVKNKK